MTGVGLEIGHERLVVKLPEGYTLAATEHKKLDSPNTIGQRELVFLTIKEHGWPT